MTDQGITEDTTTHRHSVAIGPICSTESGNFIGLSFSIMAAYLLAAIAFGALCYCLGRPKTQNGGSNSRGSVK